MSEKDEAKLKAEADAKAQADAQLASAQKVADATAPKKKGFGQNPTAAHPLQGTLKSKPELPRGLRLTRNMTPQQVRATLVEAVFIDEDEPIFGCRLATDGKKKFWSIAAHGYKYQVPV